MIKSIYKNRIKTLVSDYKKFHTYSLKNYDKVMEFSRIMMDIKKELKNITIDENIEPNKKYILLNEKLEYIEKIAMSMSELEKETLNKQQILKKDKKILIESFLEDHKNLKEEDILNEISKYLKEKGLNNENI